ncbi:MAG: hypothetical protein HPY52_13445 [Firmicutes bacterium]|nr:hypothetical protein [Bacillota bacterium]
MTLRRIAKRPFVPNGLLLLGLLACTGVFLKYCLWEDIYPGITSKVVSSTYSRSSLPPGARILGCELGGLSADDARERLLKLAAIIESEPVVLRYGGQEWRFDPKAAGIDFDVEATLKEVLSVRRQKRWYHSIWPHSEDSDSPIKITPIITGNTEAIHRYLSAIAQGINRRARNSYIFIDNEDHVHVIGAEPGRYVDHDRAKSMLVNAIRSVQGRSFELPIIPIEPEISTQEVQSLGIEVLLSSYITHLNDLASERSHNVQLALRAIDGTVLAPGEEFSFNALVGPRSRDAGYKEAPVVLGVELVPDLGGGVCQVSSTLYNAALLAGLEISARSHHSIVPAYVPPGRDATVAYDYLDLRFRNNLSHHIMVVTRLEGAKVIVKIFGHRKDKKQTRIETVIETEIPPDVIEKNDDSLPEGSRVVEDQGGNGYVVSVWRITEEGNEVKREFISRDRYKPRPMIIRVNKPL